MKKRTAFVYFIATIFLIFFGVSITFSALTGQKVTEVIKKKVESINQEVVIETVKTCSQKPKLDLETAQDEHLKKLAQYQQLCDSFVTDRLMVFIDMPNTDKKATEMAKKISIMLQDFHQHGVIPIVIVEPTSQWGLVNFSEFNSGFWDKWIITFFTQLQKNGVTQDQMGIWVPFPEANIPTWNKESASTADFGRVVNRYSRILLDHYPNTHVSVLLNSATYDVTDYDWSYGEYISLKPYIDTLEPGIISSFGLQGFPWLPQASSQSTTTLLDPGEYLNYLLLTEAAQITSVNEVWYNTGTFAAKYASNTTETATLTADERLAILNQTLREANKLQDRGLKVWINLFAENKTGTGEDTDWSYTGNDPNQQEHFKAFKYFVQELEKNDIGFALFDK